MPLPPRHSWRGWQSLTEAPTEEWPAECILWGSGRKTAGFWWQKLTHTLWNEGFRHFLPPSYHVDVRYAWPLQCKWDVKAELEASSQAQRDCCVRVWLPPVPSHPRVKLTCHVILSVSLLSLIFSTFIFWAVLITTHRKNLADGARAVWANSGCCNYVLRGRLGVDFHTDNDTGFVRLRNSGL